MTRREPVLIVDLLRFAAAAGVVGYHLVTATALPDAPIRLFGGTPPHSSASAWTWPGWVGVEIFFVISGFVIARSATAATPIGFLRRRLLRLAPAAWLCATATGVVLAIAGTLGWGEVIRRWLAALLFLPTTAMIDGSYWTLEVELVFYLVVAVAIARPDGDATGRVAAQIGTASVAFRIAATALGWRADDPGLAFGLDLLLLPHGVFFALGMTMAAAQGRGWSAAMLAGAALLATAGAVEIADHARMIDALPGGPRPAAVPILLFAAALVAMAAASRLQPLLRRWPGVAAIERAGKATYPLYLLHQVIGSALIVGTLRSGLPVGVAVALAVALVLGAAFAVSAIAEPWLRARLDRSLDRLVSLRRAPAPDTRRSASPPAG